jgi:hypothetical protein
MTPDERQMVDLFEWAACQLLKAPSRWADVEALAFVCAQVKGITAGGRDVEELALQRLVDSVEEVLTAFVAPQGAEKALQAWSSAVSELVELREAST